MQSVKYSVPIILKCSPNKYAEDLFKPFVMARIISIKYSQEKILSLTPAEEYKLISDEACRKMRNILRLESIRRGFQPDIVLDVDANLSPQKVIGNKLVKLYL